MPEAVKRDAAASRPGSRRSAFAVTGSVLSMVRMSPSISSDDAVDLRWYYSVHGAAVLDHSSFAAQLQRAELYKRRATPCQRCGGDLKRDIPGCGFVQDGPSMEPSQRQKELAALLEIYVDKIPPAPDRVCPECGGTGWSLRLERSNRHGRLTARPTGSSVRGGSGGVQVSDANVHRLGVLTRRLRRLEAVAPMAVLVIERFYGPSRAEGGGALVALWELTASGKSMLRGNRLKLDATRYFANLRAEAQQKPSSRRLAQFREADRQAAELLRNAGKAWNLVCGRKAPEVR
jgi:hypothetical protein